MNIYHNQRKTREDLGLTVSLPAVLDRYMAWGQERAPERVVLSDSAAANSFCSPSYEFAAAKR